jgi:hypothetical protein
MLLKCRDAGYHSLHGLGSSLSGLVVKLPTIAEVLQPSLPLERPSLPQASFLLASAPYARHLLRASLSEGRT